MARKRADWVTLEDAAAEQGLQISSLHYRISVCRSLKEFMPWERYGPVGRGKLRCKRPDMLRWFSEWDANHRPRRVSVS